MQWWKLIAYIMRKQKVLLNISSVIPHLLAALHFANSCIVCRGHVVIVGAGPGGSTAAILLAKRGYKVDVYERTPSAKARSHRPETDIHHCLIRAWLEANEGRWSQYSI